MKGFLGVVLFSFLMLSGCETSSEPIDGEFVSAERPPRCGDGVVNSLLEECDDGNLRNSDGCSSRCLLMLSTCGNKRVDPGEECDDGNASDDDFCTLECRRIWAF